MIDTVLLILICVGLGMAAGVVLVRYGFGLGLRILDRLKHEQTPFPDMDEVDDDIQTHTDGSID
jgi:hypothetical protein